MPEALDMLENPTLVEVLLCIVSGKDYSSAIAKALKKSQPTVTEQLKQLESAQLVNALGRKQALSFEVNWDMLLQVFYDVVFDILELREEYFSGIDLKRITRSSLEGIVPRILFKDFLKEYFSTVQDLGGKRKGFDEIIFSFFVAIERLDERDWKKLLNQYQLDGVNLRDVANVVGFEICAVEETALTGLIMTREEPNKK